MAKYQACKFLRYPPKERLKSEVKWERGIAKVRSFNMDDVIFIIDWSGNIVHGVHRYRLINEPAYCVIDTDAVG